MASAQATKRLTREYATLQQNPAPYIVAHPSEDNILEWHYVLTGPPDTPYAGGQYWGVLQFPHDYPFKPPAIRMHTPSGRFQPSARLCLSISDFHPKSFNPAWGVGTILIGLTSFMTSEEMTTGSVRASDADRKTLAARSRWWNCTGNGTSARRVTVDGVQYGNGAAGAAGATAAGMAGVGAVRAGDGGAKFAKEWPELNEENWQWLQARKVDPATGRKIVATAAATTASGESAGGSCSPETSALRRRLAPGANSGIAAAADATQAGQGWLGKNKWKLVGVAIFAYILLARALSHQGKTE